MSVRVYPKLARTLTGLSQGHFSVKVYPQGHFSVKVYPRVTSVSKVSHKVTSLSCMVLSQLPVEKRCGTGTDCVMKC